MSLWPRIALTVMVGSLLVGGRGHVARFLRAVDQRAGVFSTLSLHHWAEPATVFAEIDRVLRPGGVALIYDLRPFAYLRHELEVFLAGTAFESASVERELVHLGPLPALFVRIRLVKPPEA